MKIQILSRLKNQDELCSGVRFARHKEGMLSEELDPNSEEVKRFLRIPGYEVYAPDAENQERAEPIIKDTGYQGYDPNAIAVSAGGHDDNGGRDDGSRMAAKPVEVSESVDPQADEKDKGKTKAKGKK